MASILLAAGVRWLLLAILGCVVRPLSASSEGIPSFECPLEFRESLLWVTVTPAASERSLNFLLDSGATVNVLDVGTARRLGLALGPRTAVAGVGTRRTGHWPVRMKAELAGLPLDEEYLALDLGRLSKACARQVDGLLGVGFFRDRVVEIDYQAHRLRILETRHPTGVDALVPLRTDTPALLIEVRVNGGAPQRVRVDTGCATALEWVNPDAHPERGARRRSVGLTELSVPQAMTGVRIGSRTFDTVPAGLHERPIFPGEFGLVGNALLAQFGRIVVDAESGRLALGRVGGE